MMRIYTKSSDLENSLTFCSFMFIGWLLSMFLSNAASCAMMIPIAVAVLEELKSEEVEEPGVPLSEFEGI